MVAGEISSALDVPPTNLSFHLKAMTHASLLTVEQEGRYQRYRANISVMVEVIAYLTAECCAGNPGQCVELNGSTECGPVAVPIAPPAKTKRSAKATATA